MSAAGFFVWPFCFTVTYSPSFGRRAGIPVRECNRYLHACPVSTDLGVPWALTSIGRRQALPPSCLALFLDGDHFGRLWPERGHCAREVEDVAFTADAKNHPRMLCGHRFWLRALPRVWKRSEFRWHSDTTIPLLGIQKLPKATGNPGGRTRNHASIVRKPAWRLRSSPSYAIATRV